MCSVSVKSVLLAPYSIANEVSSITANEIHCNNIDFLEDVVIGSTIFQDVKITNDLAHLLHVEPKNETVTLKVFYHILCNLENGKNQSEIHYDSYNDYSELENISLDNNESKASIVDELNQHEAEVNLVKFKTFSEVNIVKLKDRLNALTPKKIYKNPYRLGIFHSVVSITTLKEILNFDF